MRVHGVELVHWNPRRNSVPLLRRFPVGPRVDNFGDLLGPVVVTAVLNSCVNDPRPAARPAPRLLTIGSVMHFARDGDVVWGTGVNGKEPPASHRARRLDIRAVRGPLTAQWLAKELGITAPPIYGDPALLLPRFFPAVTRQHRSTSLALVPNVNEVARYSTHPAFIDPRGAALSLVRRIATADAVVTSSLHGLIVAESLGIPCALLRSACEPPFKYVDYARGTGRSDIPFFDDVAAATRHATRSQEAREPQLTSWSPTPLLDAFPRDLWAHAPATDPSMTPDPELSGG